MSKKSSNFAAQNCLNMKRFSLLFVSLLTLLCFTSCENGSGDVLKGVWKYVPGVNSSTTGNGLEGVDMKYVFDGKGNFTHTVVEPGFEPRTSKGTYTHVEDSKLVSLHGVSTNEEGISKEFDTELWLDISTKPYTLSTTLVDGSGSILAVVYYEKQ